MLEHLIHRCVVSQAACLKNALRRLMITANSGDDAFQLPRYVVSPSLKEQ